MYDIQELFAKLRAACGYWQNGTETTVTISQDDATRTFIVTVGNITYSGDSLEDCINQMPKPIEYF